MSRIQSFDKKISVNFSSCGSISPNYSGIPRKLFCSFYQIIMCRSGIYQLTKKIAFTVVVSVLGYCILPIVALSALSILVSLTGPVGTILTMLAVVWSSWSASKLFVTAFDMEKQQFLIAYPCCMLYAVFALITMF